MILIYMLFISSGFHHQGFDPKLSSFEPFTLRGIEATTLNEYIMAASI